MTRRTLRPRGLLLYELMLGLTMMATFAAAATYVLRSSLRVAQRADQAVERGWRFDAATTQLRSDVWNASAVSTPDARTVRIERFGEPPVAWTVGDGGTLTRAVGDADPEPREWAATAEGVSFESSGPATLLLVEPPDFRGGTGRRVPFVSQVALANGGKQ
jgi:type II secretory pathway pseudopilin PulG